MGGEFVQIIESVLSSPQEMVCLWLWQGRRFKVNLKGENWTTGL